MSEKEPKLQVQPIEILSFVAGDASGEPVVLVTVRPSPAVSPHSRPFAVSWAQAQRAYEDLGVVLAEGEYTGE